MMTIGKRFGWYFVLILFGVVLTTGCSRTPETAKGATTDGSPARTAGGADGAAPEGAATAADTNADSDSSEPAPFEKSATGKKSSLVPNRITIPQGTAVTVRMQSGVSSANAQAGETFSATLDEPIVVGGRTVAKTGAAVVGKVVAARRTGRLHNPGYLKIALASIVIDGKQVPVSSTSVAVQGSSHKKRNMALIGGGTGLGALIGGLAGGGKGALIGAGAGAAAGTTGAYATGKKDVGFGPERRLTFRLTEAAVAG